MIRKAKMFTDLPVDIVDRILTFLPDFNTLSAALRTSKRHIYDVFQAHPKSIVLAIAYSIVGPALPYAIRMIRICDRTVNNMPAKASDFDLPGPIDESDLLDVSLTRNMVHRLTEDATALLELEDLFSLWYKDRTSTRSVLTPAESLRFHRAMWHFSSLTVLGDAEDKEDFEEEMIKLMKTIPTQQLYEVDRVKTFLERLMGWSIYAFEGMNNEQEAEMMIAAGPSAVLSAFKDIEYDDLYEWTDNGGLPFSEAFEKTWCLRRINANEADEKSAKAILDSVHGEKDECARCNAPSGVKLWGANNYWLLRGFHSPYQIYQHLGGRLWQNPVEGPLVVAKITEYQAKDRYGQFIEDLMDLNADDGTGETWDKTKGYCDQCVVELWNQRLRKWWLAEKIKAGAVIGEDCWYGYNCRTQVHKRAHAERLNHVCDPTRGDAA